jgi:hypothetical protein
MYFDDGSVAQACPPLKALLHIMAHDRFEGKDLDSPEIRNLFRRDTLLESDWYQDRLKMRQRVEQKLWNRHIRYLEKFLKRKTHVDEAERLGISARLDRAVKMLQEVESQDYQECLRGTIGTQPTDQFLPSPT